MSWKKVNGWLDKIYKKISTYKVQYINTKQPLVRQLHAADVRYHLACWLDVTVNYKSAGPVQVKQLLLLY